jgi:hypothetical protein
VLHSSKPRTRRFPPTTPARRPRLRGRWTVAQKSHWKKNQSQKGIKYLTGALAPQLGALIAMRHTAIGEGSMPLIEPERIASDLTPVLTTAFDNAWAKFKASGSALAGEDYAPSTRDLLAKRIIERAQKGERDTNRLVDDGIAYLSELK